MVKSIRIFKKEKDAPNTFGAINKKWEPEHLIVAFAGKPFVEIVEGDVLDKETNQPIPVLDLVAELVKQNRSTTTVGAKGKFVKPQFNSKWVVDYHPELEEFFKINGLIIPADKKSYGERIQDQMLGSLEMQGFISRGLGTTDGGAAGVKAIYEAKLKAEQEELAKVRAEKDALIAEMKALEETKKPKKKDEVVA